MPLNSIPFIKMHGAGNDYIMIAAGDLPRALAADKLQLSQLSKQMSARHTGIGSDGIIIIHPSERAAARMEMYNSDGSPSDMCGNGLRLVAKFIFDHQHYKNERFTLESAAGVHDVQLQLSSGEMTGASIEIGAPEFGAAKIPLNVSKSEFGEGEIHEIQVDVNNKLERASCLSMGNPHCVIFINNLSALEIHKYGPPIEKDPRFPRRTNVEFVEMLNSTHMKERTWERGAGETLSCGSGACAAAVVAIASGRAKSPVRVEQLGGTLEVRWERGGKVVLSGPARTSFRGEWALS